MQSDRDGVIKFNLDFHHTGPVSPEDIVELNLWRDLLRDARVIGQDPKRYDNVAFGNISRLLPPFDAPKNKKIFLITGTQTSGLPHLDGNHFSRVVECVPEQNRLRADGAVPPSSEAMTHAMIYDLDPALRWVMHGHSPDIWSNAEALGLPLTDRRAAYGTPEMAAEVGRLFSSGRLDEFPFFVMGGHEDGVISFGRNAEEAGLVFLNVLAKARAL